MDDRPGVIEYIREKCPDLSADDIGRVVDAITQWLDEQQAIDEVMVSDGNER